MAAQVEVLAGELFHVGFESVLLQGENGGEVVAGVGDFFGTWSLCGQLLDGVLDGLAAAAGVAWLAG